MAESSVLGVRGVPDYELVFSSPVSAPACLVIPVVNEGERLHSLLARIAALKSAGGPSPDVIIVDGGSTDGSLEEARLRDAGVAALLVKTGPGRLSAQLRCAYHHALARGYRFILTIDGNDKDDPAAIPLMLAKLEEGHDFVQASRFIPGGRAVNTPLSRTLAIRLLHAPLLRLASGFPWTDTTQGFRGYSARALSDTRVDIFRDVFRGYELLAYLSYRLPRLGFRCVETPSARVYPPGTVPTKISRFRGNLEVFAVLLKTVLGRYNPKKEDV